MFFFITEGLRIEISDSLIDSTGLIGKFLISRLEALVSGSKRQIQIHNKNTWLHLLPDIWENRKRVEETDTN